MSEMWPHQRVLYDEALTRLERINRLLIQLATGGGKTWLAVHLLRALGLPTLWLADRKELVEQGAATLTKAGLMCGTYVSGRYKNTNRPHVAALIQSIEKWDIPKRIRLVIIDEAHEGIDRWSKLLSRLDPEVKVIGLTATPCRTDGRGLGDIFEEMILGPSVVELIENGFLVPFNVTSPVSDGKGLAMDPVEAYRRYAKGRQTIIYCSKTDYSKALAERFRSELGVTAEHADGTTRDDVRDRIVRRARAGQVQVLCNVGLWTKGLDIPSLECIINADRSQSHARYLQKMGRALRISPATGKTSADLIDLTPSSEELGDPGIPRDWVTAFQGDGKVKSDKAELGKQRRCPEHWLIYQGPHCPLCGPKEQVVGGEIKISERELVTTSWDQRDKKAPPRKLFGKLAQADKEFMEIWDKRRKVQTYDYRK